MNSHPLTCSIGRTGSRRHRRASSWRSSRNSCGGRAGAGADGAGAGIVGAAGLPLLSHPVVRTYIHA